MNDDFKFLNKIDLDEEYIDILVDDFLNDIDDSPEVEDLDDDENDY